MFVYSQLVRYNESSRAGLDRDRLTRFCFQNVYIIELLSEYGISSLENVKVVDQVCIKLFSCFVFLKYIFIKLCF